MPRLQVVEGVAHGMDVQRNGGLAELPLISNLNFMDPQNCPPYLGPPLAASRMSRCRCGSSSKLCSILQRTPAQA